MLLEIIIGIIVNKTSLSLSLIVIYSMIFIINNQLMVFSYQKKLLKIIGFILEIALIIVGVRFAGGYIFTYFMLAVFDCNLIFENPLKLIFDACIILLEAGLLFNSDIKTIFVNITIVLSIMLIIYFMKDENNRKIIAQELYDKLRVSEEKLKKANKELEVYASSIEEVTLLRERNRLSREIHDSVGHALSTIVIQLGAIERIIDKDSEKAKKLVFDMRKFTQKSLDDVRLAVREIRPKEFEEYEGIIIIEEFIKNLKKLTGIDIKLSFTKEKWSLNKEQTFVIYRIIQEFIVNSVRHGKADRVNIFMSYEEDRLHLTLKDNGCGCENVVEGIGLKGMRERVNEISGDFEYYTKPNEGFIVKAHISKVERLQIYPKEEQSGEN